MENQHRQIKGYRELNEHEIKVMNAVKAHGELTGALLDEMEKDPDVDRRWLAIARTQLQQGLMALTRSVAKPTTF